MKTSGIHSASANDRERDNLDSLANINYDSANVAQMAMTPLSKRVPKESLSWLQRPFPL